MAEYRVVVSYTVEVDDEMELLDARFRLWRQTMGRAADGMSEAGQQSVVLALSQFVGRHPGPQVPGSRVLGSVVNVEQ